MTSSLTTSITTGITLTSGGPDTSPFTVTSTGGINAYAAETYGALTGIILSTIVNAGNVSSNRYGIYLRDGGTLTNSGSIDGGSNGVKGEDISHITRISPGTYHFTYSGYTTTLVNAVTGRISASGYAVQFNYGGDVVNYGSISASDNGAGAAIHVLPGSVLNHGYIGGGLGIELTNGGLVDNFSGGVIQGLNPGSGIYPGFGTGVQLGAGDATVVNAGQITGGYEGISDRYGGNIDINNSGIITGGSEPSTYGYDAGIWVYGNSGTVTIQNSGTIASAQGSTGEAVTIISAALDLIVDSGAKFTGSVSADAGLSNLIELTSAATAGTIAGIGSQFTGFQTISVDLGAAWTIEGDAAGLAGGQKITGLTGHDTIDVTNIAAATDGFDSTTGVLTLFSAGNVELGTLQLGFNDFNAHTTFALTGDGAGGTDITTNAICYLRGTRIVTARGEMPVEHIRPGDLVATRNLGLQPVLWIGRQSFARRFVQNNKTKIPVKIRAGALGEGLPVRDLFVSPGHSMLLGKVLILASQLINGITITQDFAPDAQPETIDYFQFELATHDCLLAEGAWSESFADGPGLRAQFHNAPEYLAQHPDYAEPAEPALCAPRPVKGPAFEQALLPVAARAAAAQTTGPLEGWIDDIIPGLIAGWAIDSANPLLPIQLEIWAGETHLGTALACEHRPDLEEAGKGRGVCAFYFALPIPVAELARAGLRITRAGETVTLPLAGHCRERLRNAA